MLSNQDLKRIFKHAHIPEHLVSYVEAISGAEPTLLDGHLCFVRKKHLIFNGYPLWQPAGVVQELYRKACERFRPATVAILAPELWPVKGEIENQASDQYYRLSLPLSTLDPDLTYMVRRGKKELSVGSGTFSREHRLLIKKFLKTHDLSKAQNHIFRHVHLYLKRSPSARILEARHGNQLAAFSVIDLGAADYAFYLFHFRSVDLDVTGASDLLISEMVSMAEQGGKRAINLGLGVSPGIRHFKEKWGGKPFLPYQSAFVNLKPMGVGELSRKL